MPGFLYEKDNQGIVVITMDMAGSVNAMNEEYHREMAATLTRLEGEPRLAGVVITSAKRTFFAGGDLNYLAGVQRSDAEPFFELLEGIKARLRRLERLPVPVVAAINGAAMGGGFEICLACNRRIVLDDSSAQVGLPEVTLGLLPGGGGIVRLVRLLGLEKALPHLLSGKRYKPPEALAAGLVDEIAPNGSALIARAKEWILANPNGGSQPWDVKGHAVPGGTALDPSLSSKVVREAMRVRRSTRALLPAPERILAIAAESTLVDFDTALRIETRGLAYLTLSDQAKNIITSSFFQLNKVRGGGSRPSDQPKSQINRMAVIGAGMMGRGIAFCAARAGIRVVLLDTSMERARAGADAIGAIAANQLAKGILDQRAHDTLLSSLAVTDQASDVENSDVVIEAIFEDLQIKEELVRSLSSRVPDTTLIGSNTSTLSITALGDASAHPGNVIGMHFFSPVERMPLVEIVAGRRTSERSIARAFDLAMQLGKLPILVRDAPGFFTSRVFGTYLDEGARLLEEGVDPIIIENLAKQVGMPNGPLATHDEISQELTRRVSLNATPEALAPMIACTRVGNMMIERFGRGGRQHGGGYYDYPAAASKRLWPELKNIFPVAPSTPEPMEIKDRLLFRPVIESLRCLDEGVLQSTADGNVGSLFGIGAPTWTGGYLQFVNGFGVSRFVERAHELATSYGERFEPPPVVLRAAADGVPLG